MEGKRIAHLVYLVVTLISADFAASEVELETEDSDGVVKITYKGAKSLANWTKDDLQVSSTAELKLDYLDHHSGEYKYGGDDDAVSLFVKFRTCDNCVALDIGTVVGIVMGEVVATALIGVAVYLLGSQPQGRVFRQTNQASDRQNLIQNQQNDSTYQQLTHGTSSEYSHLEPRRGRKH